MRSTLLTPVRRGRPVVWVPDFMGPGNVLLIALWAHQRRALGEDCWVLMTSSMSPWLSRYEGLRDLFLAKEDIRFTDRRLMPWRDISQSTDPDPVYDRGFSNAELEEFVRTYLLPGLAAAARTSDLVVNVRRGDYYSDPQVREAYGFDQVTYLRAAMEQAVDAGGPVDNLLVVSDGPDWCRERLGWLADYVGSLSYAPLGGGPLDHFLTVARSRRLIITNSTFSYWAGYLSNALYMDNHKEVVAPRFFDRSRNHGRSWLLDDRWTVIEDLPGGWDSWGES